MRRMPAVLILVLAGCTTAPSDDVVVKPSLPQPSTAAIRTMDWSNTALVFFDQGMSQGREIQFTDGVSELEGMTFSIGEPVFADADNDGDEDAAFAITASNESTSQVVWDILLATDDGTLQQVGVPFALETPCGDLVDSVTAAGDGGFQVVQHRRLTADMSSCAEPPVNLQERIITVRTDDDGTPWPQQTAPVAAWGGICPNTPWLDTDSTLLVLYTGPSADAPKAINDAEVGVFPLDTEPYGLWEGTDTSVDQARWELVGFVDERTEGDDVRMHCAWAEIPG